MVRRVLIALLVVFALFFTYIALQPPDYTIVREMKINASPEAIFPLINNSKKADEWMPWKDSDPSVKMTYSGPEEGVGSKSDWDSTGSMGTGSALVVESVPNERVKTQLTYTKPMEMTQTAEITLTPDNNATIVRWSVVGKNNFVGRLFCFFIDMDKFVGGEFEKGLSKLKTMTEAKPPTSS